MKKLFVFNGAGTLLDSEVSGFRWLAREIGQEREEKRHLRRYRRVKKEGPWGLEELAALFKGISQRELKEKSKKFIRENLMFGARELINILKVKHYFVAFYSSDPMEICEALKQELSLDDIYSNELEYESRKATGKLKEKVDRYDRADRIKEIVKKNKLRRDSVYIIGDSVTALPSKDYGIFISFNSKDKEVDEKADFVVKEKDLTKILEFIE
ncbi:haloacid dehalogenase-like hydrolase [Candidatus Pacearchaeota archaeon]|nr:haloacid dehalogenase-like hydrolase [Candidatus Pacearchaeota archaeon]